MARCTIAFRASPACSKQAKPGNRAHGNCVRAPVPAIANFRESRNDDGVKRSSFARFAVTFFRRQSRALILNTIWQKSSD